MDPIEEDMGRGQEIVTITRGTRLGGLGRIDRVYYQNSYPVTEWVVPDQRTKSATHESWQAQLCGAEERYNISRHFEWARPNGHKPRR